MTMYYPRRVTFDSSVFAAGRYACGMFVKMVLVFAALFGPPAAFSQDSSLAAAQAAGLDYPTRRRSFTPGELARLPEYCQYMMGMPGRETPRGQYYLSMLGKGLDDIHHYCRGLRDIAYARTFALPPVHKQALWDRAAKEVQYMISTNPDTLIIMPEIHYRYGEIMLELGRVEDAQLAFEKSRTLKPDYWPAYTLWADFLIRTKQIDQARAIVEQGLKHAPDSVELQRRRSQLAPGAKSP